MNIHAVAAAAQTIMVRIAAPALSLVVIGADSTGLLEASTPWPDSLVALDVDVPPVLAVRGAIDAVIKFVPMTERADI